MAKLTNYVALTALFYLTIGMSSAQSGEYEEPDEDDTVNLHAVGTEYTADLPRCVFPFRYNGKLHNGCLSPDEHPPFQAELFPAPPDAGATTGALGWCPHNYQRLGTNNKPIRFRPFDTYSVSGNTKKHWGYCHCAGEFFWQRLDDEGQRLSDECLIIPGITRPKTEFRALECRKLCDDRADCVGFEFIKFHTNNLCRIHSCVKPGGLAEVAWPHLEGYKQQIRRPCIEASVDFEGIPIVNKHNFTHAPTSSTSNPTSTPSPVDQETSAPSATDVEEPEPTPQPTPIVTQLPPSSGQSNTEPPSSEGESGDSDSVNPASYVVPIVAVAAGVVGFGAYKRKNRGAAEEEAEDELPTQAKDEEAAAQSQPEVSNGNTLGNA